MRIKGVTWEEPLGFAMAVLASNHLVTNLCHRPPSCPQALCSEGCGEVGGTQAQASALHVSFHRRGRAALHSCDRGTQKATWGRDSWGYAVLCKQPDLREINTCVLSSQAPGVWAWPLVCQLLLSTYRKLGSVSAKCY